MNKMGIVALTPARGGSKRLPRKNIRLLTGKPLIAYTIKEALKPKCVDRVILSTDDEEIAKVAISYGAGVPFLRPKTLAKDSSSSLSVILHALEYFKKEENYSPDTVAFLQPTSPFRNAEHVDEGIEKMRECDAGVGVCEVKQHPDFMMQERESFLKLYSKLKNRPLRRQDALKLHVLNASLYSAKREYYDGAKDPDPVAPIFEGKVKGVFMDEISSIDIDALDFMLAESMLETKNEK